MMLRIILRKLPSHHGEMSIMEGEVGYTLNRFKPPVLFDITDRSKAVLLIWLSVFACFGVSFCTCFTFYVSKCNMYLVRLR